MDCKGTSWVKKEKNEIHAEPESLFLEGTLKIGMPSLHIKQDLELKQEDGIERDCLEDNLGISHPNDFIKEDPELNLEVAASIRKASDSLSFIQSAGDSCDISYQETLHQGVVNDKLEIYAEKSTDFSVSHNYTKIQTLQEDGLCGTRLSSSIREKEFHKFNCSFCLQSFPSKYRLIMHIFIHIDGVQAPAFVCQSCGEVFPTDDCLKEHLRMREGDQALSATNSEKLECSDHENNISFKCVQEGIVEQTEEHPSCKVPRKTFKKSLKDISNTHTVKEAEEKLERCNDCGILCKRDHVHVHTVQSAKRHHKCDVCVSMDGVVDVEAECNPQDDQKTLYRKSLDVATVQDLETHCIAVPVVARLAQSSWSHGPPPPAEGDQQPTDEESRGGALAVVRSITWTSGRGLCGGLACLVAADCTNPCPVHGGDGGGEDHPEQRKTQTEGAWVSQRLWNIEPRSVLAWSPSEVVQGAAESQ
ncbi:zinc finger protein 3 homolog [Schistocerca americana]|uniref:zinc finger protein 3 homolog n=1 Tax=Schistocerca americana TaxID=7009 RepID=UPI001F501E79|nr:zinc finger protein 3 homolog [Schistocerca americana]